MATVLSVNLNKIALLRNSREGDYPSVLEFAQLAIDSGAKSLTIHPRPDQRHIRVDDVYALSELVQNNQDIEFNIEGNPFAKPMPAEYASHDYPGLMPLLEKTQAHQVTFVPDNDSQLTSDHGFDLRQDGERLKPLIAQCHKLGVRVSLFMDPDQAQIEMAQTIGADRIELYTGPYAEHYKAANKESLDALFKRYYEASLYAQSLGLGINAGHDLNLDNLERFLSIPDIKEVSIGHALTVDALLLGYKNAIQAYSRLCE